MKQQTERFLACPKCKANLNRVEVKVAGASNKAVSYQCSECDYFEFEPISSGRIVNELRDSPLKIKQKIIKLSHDRLGMYINRDVVRSLNLKGGEEVYVSIPDKKHIVVDIS